MKLVFSKFNAFFLGLNPSLVSVSLGFCLCLTGQVQAADFRSILPAKAIAYDAPSTESTKSYIMTQGYPVEVIVNLREWIKVRDQRGGLNWLEGKDLDIKLTVLVTGLAEIKLAESAESTLLATVEKDVVLEVVSPGINQGWVKVKHRDGIIGYIQSRAIWGLY
jgi:SH3-like domain-containing protein